MHRMTTPAPTAEMLGSASTTSERVQALAAILDMSLVARAAEVSPTAVKNWLDGAEPRADGAMAIDDLRSVVFVLLEGGFEPRRIRSWILSRDFEWLEGKRPLDVIVHQPMSVLSAAENAAIVHRFGDVEDAGTIDNVIPSPENGNRRRDS